MVDWTKIARNARDIGAGAGGIADLTVTLSPGDVYTDNLKAQVLATGLTTIVGFVPGLGAVALAADGVALATGWQVLQTDAAKLYNPATNEISNENYIPDRMAA